LVSALVLVLAAAAMSGAVEAGTLSGSVSSAREQTMEGVLVTVRKQGSTISRTVVSDERGQYTFPAGRLEPGRYTVTIRAVGYELSGPKVVDLKSGGTTANIRLEETADLAPQLTNSEWLRSAPGTPEQKRAFSACATCHSLSLPLLSSYDQAQVAERIAYMAGMASQAMPGLVQRRVVSEGAAAFGDAEPLARYIASINRSTSAAKFALRGFERPTGRSTHVFVTSYDLPRKTMQPHDAVMGDDGYVWISNFGENSLSRLDPKTGKVKEYAYPALRPGPYANGNLDLEFDHDGDIWLAMMNQTGISRFNRRTETFTFYPIPDDMRHDATQTSMVDPIHAQVGGKIWVQAVLEPQITRFDLTTGKYEPWTFPFQALPGFHAAYGVYSDSDNNALLCDYQSRYIVKIDAKSGAVTFFATPTDHSRPRRGRVDAQDRLWFAEWSVDKIAMLDTHSGEIKEWNIPGYMPEPYDAELDRDGWVWTDNMMDDRVTRLDPKTGRTVQYLMPIPTNARRVAVDNYGAHPALWVGANHEAVVMKVEPLD
jgi:streptogramin lyase